VSCRVQVMCEDGDLKEMGLALGPRKKLLSYLHDVRLRQVRDDSHQWPLNRMALIYLTLHFGQHPHLTHTLSRLTAFGLGLPG